MKRALNLISILLLILFGCNKEYKSTITLLPVNDCIEIKINKDSRNISKCIQYISADEGNFLAVANNVSNSIEIYNIDTKKLIKEIFIKTEGDNSFYRNFGFIAKNLDTLIVISQNPQLIGIINSKGDIINIIPYSTDIEGGRIQMTIPYSVGAQGPLFFECSLYLSQFYRADNSDGVFTSDLYKNSYLNVKVDLKTGECQKMPPVYPKELIGRNIVGMYIKRVIGYNDCLVYNFTNLNALFISYNGLDLEKKVIETNYKFKLPDRDGKNISDAQTGMRFTISHDEIVDLLYDKFKECYYVFVRKRTEDFTNELNIKFLYPDCFILILDKNLKHLGEVFLKDNTYSFKMKFITPEGLFISEDHVNNPSFSENIMRFRLFKCEELHNK